MTPSAALGAASVKLSWNPSPGSPVAGYDIYYGTSSRHYLHKFSTGNVTSATITNLTEGTTYYFSATGYDFLGVESPFSTEASYSVPLNSLNHPSTLTSVTRLNSRFSFTVSGTAGYRYAVESSSNLVTWVPLLTNTSPFIFIATNNLKIPKQFFRAAYRP